MNSLRMYKQDQYTEASGNMGKKTEEENKFGKMDQFMKDIGKMDRRMVLVGLYILMVSNLKVIGDVYYGEIKND